MHVISSIFSVTPRKYWLITQEAMAPSRHDWKIVDWDVKPQHNQPNQYFLYFINLYIIKISLHIYPVWSEHLFTAYIVYVL